MCGGGDGGGAMVVLIGHDDDRSVRYLRVKFITLRRIIARDSFVAFFCTTTRHGKLACIESVSAVWIWWDEEPVDRSGDGNPNYKSALSKIWCTILLCAKRDLDRLELQWVFVDCCWLYFY